jgi:hypothetical protein
LEHLDGTTYDAIKIYVENSGSWEEKEHISE